MGSSPRFEGTADLSHAAQLASLTPADPFSTPAHMESMRHLGWQPRLFFLREDQRVVAGCAGYLRVFPGCTALEVPSLSLTCNDTTFWRDLQAWCRASNVRSLQVQLEATGKAHAIDGVLVERAIVYEMDTSRAAAASVWPSHRALIEEATAAGIRVSRRADAAARREHILLAEHTWPLTHSLPAPGTHSLTHEMADALIDTGAAELHVAEREGHILASALVLLARGGACVHSLGLAGDAAAQGAGSLLIAEIARQLEARGIPRLTLGDAEESHARVETLIAGFATERRLRESVRMNFGSGVQRKLGTFARLARERPAALLPALLGRVERYVAYAVKPERVPPPDPRPELRLERLEYSRLAEAARIVPDAVRHYDRARRLGFSAAWGLYVGDELAHISWLVTADDDERNVTRNVKVRPGEAEIGPCSTFPAFRGQGLYPWVIRALCRVAADRGIQRVFMITSHRNISSRRGIEKAGLHRCGSIYRIVLPWLGDRSFTLRGHRWWLAMRSLPD